MKPARRKPSLQDTMEANANAMRGLCMMGGKPMPKELEAPARKAPRPHAAPSQQSNPNDLEAAVMREVAQVIAAHPRVMFAVRQNSGSVQMELKGGEVAPVWFYRWIKSKTAMKVTDYWGMLVDGRMFAIECKRRSWTRPSGEREEQQLVFILTVKYAGGIGGFCTSAERALEILNG